MNTNIYWDFEICISVPSSNRDDRYLHTPFLRRKIPSVISPHGYKPDVRKTCSANIQQIYKRTSVLKCLFMGDFMVWLFSCKFVVGFRNTFSKHLWNLILTAHTSMRNVFYVWYILMLFLFGTFLSSSRFWGSLPWFL